MSMLKGLIAHFSLVMILANSVLDSVYGSAVKSPGQIKASERGNKKSLSRQDSARYFAMSELVWKCMVLVLICISLVSICTGDFNLTVLHTNDCYDRIEETDENGLPCTPELQAEERCFGGVARRAAVLKEIRERNPGNENIILLDTGDQFQGTDWFYVYKGNATAHFMNLLDYDAMGLAKSEFLRGVPGLIPFLDQIEFPAVSSNIDTTNEPAMDPLVSRSHVISVGSEKVGVVGVTKPETPELASTGNLVFLPVIESVQAEVDALIDDHGVNKIIALSDSSFAIDQEIARSVRGVDIVIGGHPNTFLYTGDPPYDQESKDGDYPTIVHPSYNESLEVPIVSAYLFGKYLGYLEVTFDDDGVMTSHAGNPIALDRYVAKDPDVEAEVEAWKVLVDATSNTVVGSSEVELVGRYSVCGVGECSMGFMLTDSMRFSHGMEWGVDIAMTSAGSIASSIEQGNITISDLTRTIPYGDTIDLVLLTGESILAILEQSVADSSAKSAFLQVSGILIEYDLTRPNGDRVLNVNLPCDSCDGGYEPVDDETVYEVAMNSYIAGGQEGFAIILERTISRERGNLDVDVAIGYLNEYSPITAGTEARIVIYDDEHRPNGSAMHTTPSLWIMLIVLVGNNLYLI